MRLRGRSAYNVQTGQGLIVAVDQIDAIDFASIDKESGDLWLTISDHLSWDENEEKHLVLLQHKLNAYLRFVESGEMFKKIPAAEGRGVVINLVGKFPLSQKGNTLLEKARVAIEGAGLRLQFNLMSPN